ncbi:MAG: family 20 glycosylhydrolase, partial [Planctomycetes bacterium]|nr:family 20 glycosylhydrolase [Planctomycetota bacterium]
MKGQSFFETRAFQIDLGRQPESVDTLKKIFEQGRRFHFNQCHLYLENKLQLDSFGDAAAGLSGEDVGEIVSCGDQLGLEIVPSLNLLGHTEHFTKYPEFKRLSETRDGARKADQDYAGCLCPSLPETREWARSVIEEVAEIFPSPNLHVGLDETWPIGSCPLCAEREKKGELGQLFADYANCLHDKALEYGKTMWMWADMLFYFPGAMEELNKDIVLVDWFYGGLDPIPRQTFFNWRRVHTTEKLLEEGFRVVPASGLGMNNLRGFTRYVDGFDTDTFLVTQWEGSNRFQLDYAPERCAAGILLSSNHMPQMREMGRYLLPDGSAGERQKFMTAVSASGRSLEVVPEMLTELDQTPLVKACRSRVLQKYVGQESGKIMRELKLIARDMLRENRHS